MHRLSIIVSYYLPYRELKQLSFNVAKQTCISFDSYHYITLFERSLLSQPVFLRYHTHTCAVRRICFLILRHQLKNLEQNLKMNMI